MGMIFIDNLQGKARILLRERGRPPFVADANRFVTVAPPPRWHGSPIVIAPDGPSAAAAYPRHP